TGNFVEGILSGKTAIFSGVWWHAAWPLTTMLSEDSEVEWIAVPVLPSEKVSNPKTTSVPLLASHLNMVSADCEHPEALAKLLSLDYELQVNGVTRWGRELAVDSYEGNWKYVWMTPSIYDVEHDSSYRVANAKTAEEAKAVIAEPVNQGSANLTIALEGVYRYIWEDSKADWGWYFSRAPLDAGLGLVQSLYENDKVNVNAYNGAPLKANVEYGTALQTMTNEIFSRIIMGDSIEKFDEFCTNWISNGGEKIIEEANS
ncbi:MAG: hypothetical protein RR396_05205, partial [Clostridiales bacterium]